MITFSFHAKQRMNERNISEEQIKSVIKNGKRSDIKKSSDPNVKILYSDGIFVAINKNNVVVTVFTLAQTRNVVDVGSVSLFT